MIYLFILLHYFHLTPPTVPPPGTIPIGENRFIDKQIISVLDYEEFVFYQKTKNQKEYETILPRDSSITYKKKNIFSYKKKEKLPILGLSLEQINAYCLWRSEIVSRGKNDPSFRCHNEWIPFDIADPDKKYKITYRLPTEEDLQQQSFLVKEKIRLQEHTQTGIYKKTKNSASKFSPPNLTSFRCVAYYELR